MRALAPYSPRGSIDTDTAAGNPIPNTQDRVFGNLVSLTHAAMTERFAMDPFDRRADPTPMYNCHGLVFGCRRTGIFDTRTVRRILREDGYRPVPLPEVLPGDVVLYVADDGDIEHSGIVITRPTDHQASPFGIPRVLSKWGTFVERLHWANQCPYNFSRAEYHRFVAPPPVVAGPVAGGNTGALLVT